MEIKIALAGNPNCGKTTLFNALTGSNQFVGNWPGVTVEKKEGRLKKHSDVIIMDLPGIYSLSPYTQEEVVARNYLVNERPDAILNLVDGTNLERNLYLTTQLTELGIPVVIAINMMDVVLKNGDHININELSHKLGCRIVEISALKGTGIIEAAEAAVEAAKSIKTVPMHSFSGAVEHTLAHIEEAAVHERPAEQQRWYAIKIFERDQKVLEQLKLEKSVLNHIEEDIKAAEKELDDDSESIITNERYLYISSILKGCYKRKNTALSVSDRIDKVVTNRFAAIPIFAAVMFIIYFLSVTTIGSWATNWANDGLFGDGWHLFGIGSTAYDKALNSYKEASVIKDAFEEAAKKAGINPAEAKELTATAYIYDAFDNVEKKIPVTFSSYMAVSDIKKPAPDHYGVWIPGIPVLLKRMLDSINTAEWLNELILGGIVSGVGSVLGFVPQMLVLFFFLAFLEACGYMSRIAFVMDRIFRKVGLSGKSFIPMLIGTGCSVPGIMASRTIENLKARRMTIMTTTFIPCGAKLPIIALISGAMFGGDWWVAPSAYFLGFAAIITSGIMLKKTRLFSGESASFIMELPSYHLPTLRNVLRSMWERSWSFVKKAGTVILIASIIVWFTSNFGWSDGSFKMVDMDKSILAAIGSLISWIFIPIGWGHWQGTVASITGLIAKENIVGTFGVLFGGIEKSAGKSLQVWVNMREIFTPLSSYSFLIFNLLCAPCFAAISAIRREMNSAKWTFFAIAYQCVFAYAVSLVIYQFGMLFAGSGNIIGSLSAFFVVAFTFFMLLRRLPEK